MYCRADKEGWTAMVWVIFFYLKAGFPGEKMMHGQRIKVKRHAGLNRSFFLRVTVISHREYQS